MAAKRKRRRIDGTRVHCEAVDLGLVKRCEQTMELEWHHIEYLCNGGSDDDDNVCVVCSGCHSKIHQERGDWVEFGRKGGLRTLELYGKEHFRELARARWIA